MSEHPLTSLHSVADCPNLLCDEQEPLETSNVRERAPRSKRKRKRKREEEEQVFNERRGKKAKEETEQDGNEKRVSEKDCDAAQGEGKTKSLSRVEVDKNQEVQREDSRKDGDEGRKSDEQPCGESKVEQKKSKKRRGRKQSERIRNKRGVKDGGEKLEGKKRCEAQEVSVQSSKVSSALSEPFFGLMNSSDVSDPIYLGCGATGLYGATVPIPLLYSSSQTPVTIQPAPPPSQGTKRPPSPLLSHSLPQQGPQSLEVRLV